jgi:hypothetical protein
MNKHQDNHDQPLNLVVTYVQTTPHVAMFCFPHEIASAIEAQTSPADERRWDDDLKES